MQHRSQATIDLHQKFRANNDVDLADLAMFYPVLCDSPKVTRYRDIGDLESAASFVCE